MVVRLDAEAGALHAVLALHNVILVGHMLRLVRGWHEVLLLVNVIVSARGTLARKVAILQRANK